MQSLVCLFHQQLFWFRKLGIMGNTHRSVVFKGLRSQSSGQEITRLNEPNRVNYHMWVQGAL